MERYRILIRCGNYSNKEVDLGEPTSFLDHVYLGCTQILWTITEPCSNREFPRREQRNYHSLKIFVFHHGLMTWLVMQRNVWNDIVSWQTRRHNNSTKYLLPCIDDHHFKEEEMKSVGELSQVCSQIVLKCLYLACIGRPDILWSVNKLARSIRKWTKACDKLLNGLISCNHHLCEYKQFCYVGNTEKQCILGLFQDSDFAEDLEDSKSTSGGTLCVFGSHTFVPISWMCKKQTAVSHSSTESEIIFLDAGTRLDGIPALDLWDLIVLVLGNTTQTTERPGRPGLIDFCQRSQRKTNVLSNICALGAYSHAKIYRSGSTDMGLFSRGGEDTSAGEHRSAF